MAGGNPEASFFSSACWVYITLSLSGVVSSEVYSFRDERCMHETLYWEVFRDTDTLKSLPWLIAKQNDIKGRSFYNKEIAGRKKGVIEMFKTLSSKLQMELA